MSRRWRIPVSSAGRRWDAPPAPVAPPPSTDWIFPILGHNPPKVMSFARGQTFAPIPEQTSPTPPTFQRHRTATLMVSRRGQSWEIVLPPASQWIPYKVAPAKRQLQSISRRGQFWEVVPPPASQWLPYKVGEAKRPPYLARRGQTWEVVPPQVIAQPTVWIPEKTGLTKRRLYYIPRRGEIFQFPMVGAAPAAPPPYPVQNVVRRVQRIWTVRRGKQWLSVPDQVSPPPDFTRPRVQYPWQRRGQFTEPQWTQLIPLPPVSRRRTPLGFLRRGRFLDFPKVGAGPPAAPPYPPEFSRSRPMFSWLPRRGRSFEPPKPIIVAAPTLYPFEYNRTRVNYPWSRRGNFVEPPWQQNSPPPTYRRTRQRYGFVPRRGKVSDFPKVGFIPAGPGPLVFRVFRRPLKVARIFLYRWRSKFYNLIPPQIGIPAASRHLHATISPVGPMAAVSEVVLHATVTPVGPGATVTPTDRHAAVTPDERKADIS